MLRRLGSFFDDQDSSHATPDDFVDSCAYLRDGPETGTDLHVYETVGGVKVARILAFEATTSAATSLPGLPVAERACFPSSPQLSLAAHGAELARLQLKEMVPTGDTCHLGKGSGRE